MSRVPETKRPFAPPDTPPRYARSRTYDTRHIRLELELDPRRPGLQGVATLTLAALDDGLRSLALDLSTTLQVRSLRRAGGAALRFTHADDRLHVDLGRALRAGREVQIEVAYHGLPRRGLYYIGPDATRPQRAPQIWSQGQDEDSKFWFPCFDSPHDKATSEIVVTVPKPYRAIANGQLLSVRERRGKRVFHWRESFPHPAYLLSIVVGEYEELQHEVDDVRLSYYVPAAATRHVERTFGRTPAMLRFFAAALNYPYPYEKYSQVVVQDFIFGGMENISATTLTDAVFLDEVAAQETHCDNLIAHELAHQWWGNLLTCKDWSHAWLNEGFATYAEALFLEHHRGRDEFLWKLHTDAEEYFKEDAVYRRPIVERRYTKPVEIFDRHLYEKGGLVLHMLRHELGERHFWKALQHYTRKHAFQNVETADFKVAIEEATGRHLDAFFDQWVYGAGFPELEASWTWDAETKRVALQVQQTPEGETRNSCFTFACVVELGDSRRPQRQRLQIEQARQTLFLPAARRPLYLRLDPDHVILKRLRYEPSRAELLAQLEHARDLFGQVDAARGLARYVGDAEVGRALRGALGRARFHATAGEIALALARVGGAAARAALAAGLTHRDPRRRRVVLRALGELRDDAEVEGRLVRHWARERGYLARAEILRSLGRRRAGATFGLCVQAMRLESFRDCIRAAALEVLGNLDDERAIRIAQDWCGAARSRWARQAAMLALASLAQSFPARAREVRAALEDQLDGMDFFGAIAAAEALGKLGRPEALPALRRLERADVDRRVQRAASAAIRLLGEDARRPEAWKSLEVDLRVLRRENDELRRRLERLEATLPRRRAAKRTTKKRTT